MQHTMNADPIKDRPVRIMWSQRDPSIPKSGVYIMNLDKSIDTKSLFDTFSVFGNVLGCEVVQDKNGLSMGYGFVHFETEAEAIKSIDKLNGMQLNDRKVFVRHFIPRQDDKAAVVVGEKKKLFTNVYVKNFGNKMSNETLYKMFEKYGKIISHKAMPEYDWISCGFGYVAYESTEADDFTRKIS